MAKNMHYKSFSEETKLKNDFDSNTLFGQLETTKVSNVKELLIKEILSGKISNNIEGLKKALSLRCLPKVFTETVKDLEKRGKINRYGCKSYKSTDIHRIKENQADYYKINILK